MKKNIGIIFAITIANLGCSKINKIVGDYDLEVGGNVCHLLDVKTVKLDSSSITVTGGGNKEYLDSMASIIEAPKNKIAQVRINNSRHSQGITTKFTKVEATDVSIKNSEWDKKSLMPDKVLFTKQYVLTLEDGKKATLYSDDKERLGIKDYKECVFRK